jgi:hypothetical protein
MSSTVEQLDKRNMKIAPPLPWNIRFDVPPNHEQKPWESVNNHTCRNPKRQRWLKLFEVLFYHTDKKRRAILLLTVIWPLVFKDNALISWG